MPKFSQIPTNNAPALTDYQLGVTSGGVDYKSTLAVLAALISLNLTDATVNIKKITNPYRFHAYRTAAINGNSGATTKLPYETELYDPNNNYDNVTNYRYTIPVTGVYHFDYKMPVTATNGYYLGFVYKNGVEYKRTMQGNVTSTVVVGGVGSGDFPAVAGDYFEIYWRNDGGAAAWELAAAAPFWNAHLISV